MKNYISNIHFSSTFIVLFIIYWLIGLVILFITEQGDILHLINSYSFYELDYPMLIISFLGNGIVVSFISLLFLLFDLKKGITFGLTLVFVGILTNILKRVVFMQYFRPLWYYHFDDFHRLIENVPINYFRAFPSGHSMTAFAMVATFSFFYKHKALNILLFSLALIISLSRIYLCQHYFVDTFWGAIVGIAAAYFGLLLCNFFEVKDKQGIMKQSLIKLLVSLRK